MLTKIDSPKDKNKARKLTTYCVTVAYDGSHFFGWAKQPGSRTVEGEITKILKAIFQVPIIIQGASRTDSGVHALGQIFTFTLPFYLAASKVKMILAVHFDFDIAVKSVVIVANNYDLRKNVKFKQYRYFINTGSHNPFQVNYQYQYCHALNVRKLKQALKLFLGSHYFYNFSGLVASDQKSPYRIIDSIKVCKKKHQIIIIIQAKGFLRYQIRYLIAASLDYCQDKITLATIQKYLSSQTTEKYPYAKIAAAGLYLHHIKLVTL